MPCSVSRSTRTSGQSVMVAMRAMTGRLSLSTTGRARTPLSVKACGLMASTSACVPRGATQARPARATLPAAADGVNSLIGILLRGGRHAHQEAGDTAADRRCGLRVVLAVGIYTHQRGRHRGACRRDEAHALWAFPQQG